MSEPGRRLVPALIWAALCTAIVSSLGMLLVPTISTEMHVEVHTAQWMLTVNLLAGAIATPVMGRLSDGPHKKRLLLVALGVIFAGSVLAAVAPTFPVFLVGRALQGLSYGIVPVTIALARRYVEAPRVQSSISTLSVTVASGLGIGYPLTGIIAGLGAYQLAFWFAAVFVLTAVVVVWKVVPAGPDDRAPVTTFDFPGAALLGLGLGLLLLGISQGPAWGWASVPTVGCLVLAVLLLATWARWELTVRHPLINLRVLRNGEVLLANVAAIGLGAALYIGMSVASLVAQGSSSTEYGLGVPVVWAGFVILPLSVGSFVANRLVRRAAHRIGLVSLLPVGAVLMAAAGTLLWFAHSQLWELMLGMIVFGLGLGSSYAAMPALIARRVAAEELGSSVSFNQVLRTVGSSFGTAVSAAILAAHAGAGGEPTGRGIDLTFEVGAVVCLLLSAALLVNSLVRRRATRRQPVQV
jgi:MFS family permease